MKRAGLMALLLTSLRLVFAMPQAGERAPELGDSLSLDALQGTIVLVDFWASWCGPCASSFPWLDSLHRALQSRGFSVVAVNEDRKWDKALAFLEARNIGFPVIHDHGGAIASRYQLRGMPSSFLLDRDGIIRHVHQGFTEGDATTLEAELASLIERDGKTP